MTRIAALALLFACAVPNRPTPGLYSAATREPGLLQLDIAADGTAIFRHVITLHLPPAEIETKKVRLTTDDRGRWCLDPPPRDIAPCLVSTSSAAVVVEAKGEPVKLRLRPKR